MLMKIWFRKYWPFLAIILVFLFFRLPALDQVYHQDEYRWAMQADPNIDDASPHPPLGKQFFRLIGIFLGFSWLRFGPLLFGFLGLGLLYLIVKKISGNKATALIGAGLYSINVYSVIANLQIDVDGALLPFFVLLGYYAYLNLKNNSRSKVWWLVFVLAVIGGFMTKISFLLFIVTLLVDYGYDAYVSRGLRISGIIKKYYKLLLPGLVFIAVFSYLYIKFQSNAIEYAKHFNSLNFASRSYFELCFKILKSFVWLSPLLLLPVGLGLFDKEIFKRNRFWFVYIAVNLIFYTVLFDFARLTVERYFMFWIAPTVIISSDWLGKRVKFLFTYSKRDLALFILPIIAFVFAAMLIPYFNPAVLPLDPKIEYFNHVKSFDFNFLIPMTGGSGPIGFYVSAFFVLLVWLTSLVSLLAFYSPSPNTPQLVAGMKAIRRITLPKLCFWQSEGGYSASEEFRLRYRAACRAELHLGKGRKLFLIIFMVFGIGYNLILLEEYLSGSFYGSVTKITKETVNYVLNDSQISKVITYYDIGAYDLRVNGKYLSRFYTAPSRDYTEKLSVYKGYYMIVDFPAIDKKGRYWPYLDKCDQVKKITDKKVDAYVLNCND